MVNMTVADSIKVQLCDTDDPTELHCHYPGQHKTQPVRISLDLRTGHLWADYNPEDDATTVDRSLGVVQEWGIGWSKHVPTSEAANRILGDIAGLAQAVLHGADLDLNDQNDVAATLTDEAKTAAAQIQELVEAELSDLSDGDQVQIVDAGYWLGAGDPVEIPPFATDDELDGIADGYLAEAQSDGIHLVTGLNEFLAARRQEARDAALERLQEVAEEMADLEEERNELIARLLEIKAASQRDIGAMFGVTHPTVAKWASEAAAGPRR